MEAPDRTLLCFGDSNTYGYDPRSFLGERYPADVRWTGLLSTGWRVLEAGQNGREIPHRLSELDQLRHLLDRCGPVDTMAVMLGSNDLLQHPDFTARNAAERMELCLGCLLERRAPESVLLVAPPPMTRGTWVTEDRLLTESRSLAACYVGLARQLGVRFADAGQWGVELLFDGVHFSEAGHRAFARGIRRALL